MRSILALCLALASLATALARAGTPELPDPQAEHLTLQTAEQLFHEHSREVLAAKRAVEAAEADRTSAAQRPNPTFSAGISSVGPNTWSAPGNFHEKPYDTGVQLSQLFERGNKRQLRTDAAQSNLEASRSDLQDAQRQQMLAMHGAFYDLLLAQERARVSEETLTLFRKSVEAAQLRLKAGDIAASDLSRLRVDALRSENDVRASRADREKAQIVLAYFLGLEASAAKLTAEAPWPDPRAVAEPENIDEVLDRRPDVHAARLRYEAAKKSRDLAKAARTHDVTLGVSYDHYPTQISNNTFGVSVSVPLFVFYQFDGEIKRAEVAVNSAEEDLERIRALARADLARSRSDFESARERVERYGESLLKEAQRAADAAEFAYKRGAVGVTDLLDARRTLYATRLDAVSAQADYAKARSAWDAATNAWTQ
jgi:cobalt-zinc-cadmium efflux system outer membrane protein